MNTNKILIIVTSAINADMGVIKRADRFQQTIKGLMILRQHLPNAIILLADGSPHKLEVEKVKEIIKDVKDPYKPSLKNEKPSSVFDTKFKKNPFFDD